MADGRVLSGVLSCLDPQGNLVLSDTLALGGGGKEEEKEEEGATATTTTTTATTEGGGGAHAPLSLDDGHHHSRDPQQQHQASSSNQQDHAMGMVIVPRARRVSCCVEVEAFEVARVSAEVERASAATK